MLGTNAKNNAHQLTRNPKVRAAIDAILADQNLGPRMYREWLLQRLFVAIEKCAEGDSVATAGAVARLVRLVAQLKGELGRWRRPPPKPVEASIPSDVRRRIEEIMASADRLAQDKPVVTSPHVDPAIQTAGAIGSTSDGSTAASPPTADCAEHRARADLSLAQCGGGWAVAGPPVLPRPPDGPARTSAADYSRHFAGRFRAPFMGVL
jgi:hypothetical protein